MILKGAESNSDAFSSYISISNSREFGKCHSREGSPIKAVNSLYPSNAFLTI